MKVDITPVDEELLVKLYIAGNKPKDISFKTGIELDSVRSVLKKNRKIIKGSTKVKKLTIPEKERYAIKLFNNGYDPINIYRILNLSYNTIINFLSNAGVINDYDYIDEITVDKVNKFSETVSEGDYFLITAFRDRFISTLPGDCEKNIIVKVLKKYPHFVITDFGDFMYIDLYQGQRL